MQALNFPSFNFSIKEDEKGWVIFDILRKKFLVLTPEEWVRQHVVHFLIEHRNFPKSLMHIEASIKLGKLSKRCDVIVYNKMQQPIVLVECKKTSHKLTQADFDQISRYNMALNVPYFLLTNGLEHYFFYADQQAQCYKALPDIPLWNDICEIPDDSNS